MEVGGGIYFEGVVNEVVVFDEFGLYVCVG